MRVSATLRLLAAPFLLAAAACGAEISEPTPSPTATPAPVVDRIAYIGTGGDLFTIRADGSGRLRLTGGTVMRQAGFSVGPAAQSASRVYAWPTWAPGSTSIAVSWVTAESGAPVRMGIDVVTPLTAGVVTVFENEPAAGPRLIAPETPHYASWSSDGARLAVLAQTAAGLEAFVAGVEKPGAVSHIASGAPLFMTWAPGGAKLLLHVGDDLFHADTDSPAEHSPNLSEGSSAYGTPGWSADGRRMAYVAPAPGGGNALFVANEAGSGARAVVAVGERAALLWAPAGDRIAFADSDDGAAPYFAALRVADAATGAVRTLTTDTLLAFFWSGDGRRIAYVAVDLGRRAIEWKVVEAREGEPRTLVEFAPSDAFFGMLSVFDQYAPSHAVWSPDGERLVFAGRVTGEGADGSGADRIYVISVDSSTPPRRIADGTVAFWSWN